MFCLALTYVIYVCMYVSTVHGFSNKQLIIRRIIGGNSNNCKVGVYEREFNYWNIKVNSKSVFIIYNNDVSV